MLHNDFERARELCPGCALAFPDHQVMVKVAYFKGLLEGSHIHYLIGVLQTDDKMKSIVFLMFNRINLRN